MGSNRLALTSNRNWRNREENCNHQRSSQPSVPLPINYPQEEGSGTELPWRLFEERVRTGPFGLAHFPSQPHSPARILIINGERMNPRLLQFIHESPPRIRTDWQLGLIPYTESHKLTDPEFQAAMKKLRKQSYDPPQPKRKAWKRGLFSNRNSSSSSNNYAHEYNNDEISEGDKQCAICLESFVPKEQVLVTPCNHIFHSICLVPWVRSHGQCPVCRFMLCDRKQIVQAPNYSNNSNSTGNIHDDGDLAALDFIALVRAMEEALNWMHLTSY